MKQCSTAHCTAATAIIIDEMKHSSVHTVQQVTTTTNADCSARAALYISTLAVCSVMNVYRLHPFLKWESHCRDATVLHQQP